MLTCKYKYITKLAIEVNRVNRGVVFSTLFPEFPVQHFIERLQAVCEEKEGKKEMDMEKSAVHFSTSHTIVSRASHQTCFNQPVNKRNAEESA